jgi:tetratricopeptide (TPR) repeat protein
MTEIGGDYATSSAYAERALEVGRRIDYPLARAGAHERLGRVRHLEGDYNSARTHFRRALDLLTAHAGAGSLEASYVTEHLANLLNHQGSYEESLELFHRTLAVRRQHVAGDSSEVSAIYLGMGSVLAKLKRYDKAIAAYQAGLAMNERLFGPDNSYRVYFVNSLGRVAEETGNLEAASRYFEEARKLILRDSPDSPNLAFAAANAGRIQMKRGHCAEALPYYRESAAVFETALPEHWALGKVKSGLGRCLVEAGEFSAAEALILAGLERLEAQWDADHPDVVDARTNAATLYERWGMPEKALAYR